MHQAGVALLNQVRQCQAPVLVFLGDRDHEAQVRLDHLLRGLPHLALAAEDQGGRPPEVRRLRRGLAGQRHDLPAQRQHLGALVRGQGLPALGAKPAHPREPRRLQLAPLVLREERLARDAAPGGQAQKRAVAAPQALARPAYLVHQRLDAGVGEAKAPHRGSELALQCAPASIRRGRQCPVSPRKLDALLFKPTQLRVRRRDPVEGLHDGGTDRLFHRGEPGRDGPGALVAAVRVFRPIGPLAAIIGAAPAPVGGPDIDHVAQRQRALADRVAPGAHHRHRRQARAEAPQHRALARLDPLRQRRLPFAREERGGRQVAQVHGHRIAGEVGSVDARPGDGSRRRAIRRRPGAMIGVAAMINRGALPERHHRRVADAVRAGFVLCRSLPGGEQLGRQRIRFRHGPEGATRSDHRASARCCERCRRPVRLSHRPGGGERRGRVIPTVGPRPRPARRCSRQCTARLRATIPSSIPVHGSRRRRSDARPGRRGARARPGTARMHLRVVSQFEIHRFRTI